METGVSGYFDIPGTENFTGRFFYSEEYDKLTGNRIVSITGISIQSTVYGGTWWPGGTVSVEGETLCTMSYEGTSTHMVTVDASEIWYSISAIADRGGEFPWVSSEITSNPDGSKSVTFDVAVKLWRNSSSPTVSISGSYIVELSNVPLGLVYIGTAAGSGMYQGFIDTGTDWVQVVPYIDVGTDYVVCS